MAVSPVTDECDARHRKYRRNDGDCAHATSNWRFNRHRIGSGMTRAFHAIANTKARIMPTEAIVRAPYGLGIIESCISCPYRQERLFCDLSPKAVQQLDEITTSATYPKGATLFVQGQVA